MKQINALLLGVGAMGRIMARYMVEKQVNIVGAISRKSFVGQDLGIVIGLAEPLGIRIDTSMEDVLSTQSVDVAVVTTCSDMESFYPLAEVLLRNRVNIVTITEEAFFPGFSAKYGPKLDALARENGVTVVSTGVQDVFWLNLPAMITGACQKVVSIVGLSRVDLDMYGPATVSQYPLDLSPEEYQVRRESSSDLIPSCGIALEALAVKLSLTVSKRSARHEPIYDTIDIESNSLGKVVKAGRTCGVTEIYEIETEEGVRLETQFIEKLCRSGETKKIFWDIKGTPDIKIEMNHFPGEEITCATTVNRIPDVIDAPPGYISSGDISPISYHSSLAKLDISYREVGRI